MKADKMRFLSGVASLAIGLVCAQIAPANAADIAPVRAALVGVPSLELPSKAATLVASSVAQDKKAYTASVVEAAVRLNPSAASAIVAAISAKVPEMAPVAAATAAKFQPDQVAMIVEAASKAAPSQAAAIVAATSKELPAQYARIAVSAAKAAPESKNEILIAATAASPASVKSDLTSAAGSAAPLDVTFARSYASAQSKSGAKYYGTLTPSSRISDNYFAGSEESVPSILTPIYLPGAQHIITGEGTPIGGHLNIYSSSSGH